MNKTHIHCKRCGDVMTKKNSYYWNLCKECYSILDTEADFKNIFCLAGFIFFWIGVLLTSIISALL
jgi:hypothetical protein